MTPQGTCETHPGAALAGPCHRCGTFICDVDKTPVGQHLYCPTCAARPDVNWIDRLRKQWHGRRDQWAWMLGLVGAIELLAGIAIAATGASRGDGRWWLVGSLAVLAVTHLLCFVGVPAARLALLGVPMLCGAASLFLQHEPGPPVAWLIVTVLSIAPFSDVRHRHFYRLPVSDEAIAKYHQNFLDNPYAQWGSRLVAIGLLIPFVGLAGAVCGAIGLSRVDSTAVPPVGRRGLAVAAIVVGAVETVLHASLFFGH